jgi:cell shape-determining protein MreD
MNKKTGLYFAVIAVCFAIDSTIVYFLPFDFSREGIVIVPCVGLIVWTYFNNIIEDDQRYLFATLAGLYYAVVYANSLLIYVLLYCLYAFLGRRYMKLSRFSLFEAIVIISLTIFVQEVVLYWLMWITNVTAISIVRFAMYRLVPTFIFNVVLSIPLFYLHKKLRFEGKKDAY